MERNITRQEKKRIMRHENTRGTKYWRIEKQNEKKQGRREEEQWRFSPTNYPAPPPQYLKLRQLISAILERGGPTPWRRGGKLRRRCIFSQNLANSRTHERIHERQGLLSAGTLNRAGKRGGGGPGKDLREICIREVIRRRKVLICMGSWKLPIDFAYAI